MGSDSTPTAEPAGATGVAKPAHFARAPMRISFAGGGTDVDPYPQQVGGAVLSVAIRRYAYSSAVLRPDSHCEIRSLDLGLIGGAPIDRLSSLDERLHLLRGAVRRFAVHGRGVDIRVQSQAPPGSGLGASSTIVVAVVGALFSAYGIAASPQQVAETAVEIERGDLGLAGGTQDHYAAAFGGCNFLEFNPDSVTVNPLTLSPRTVATLEHNLLLCNLGSSRESAAIIEDQVARYKGDSGKTVEALARQKELAVEMKDLLLAEQPDAFGSLLAEAWAVKQQMSPLVATDSALVAYDVATRAGALGGKISGAGGGGFMLFYAPFTKRFEVAHALSELGHEVLDVAFDSSGLQTWCQG